MSYTRQAHNLSTEDHEDHLGRYDMSCYEKIDYRSILTVDGFEPEGRFMFVLRTGLQVSTGAQTIVVKRWTESGWQEFLSHHWVVSRKELDERFRELVPQEPEELLASILWVEELAAEKLEQLLSATSSELQD